MLPTLSFEKRLWRQGYTHIAGVDEVGRGALAGPLTVAAVIFPKSLKAVLPEVKDSKQLSPEKRTLLSTTIKTAALNYAYGHASVGEINRHGIVKATFMAMRRAIRRLRRVDFVLIDAFYVPYLRGLGLRKQLAITHGDQRSLTIAAASILAKVHRDQLMEKLGHRFPAYHLNSHKGYGTLAHRQALATFGPSPLHRSLFIRRCLKVL